MPDLESCPAYSSHAWRVGVGKSMGHFAQWHAPLPKTHLWFHVPVGHLQQRIHGEQNGSCEVEVLRHSQL